jgi:23S rRNA (guanosine2251-2'-O)-methyltransferase
MGRRPDRSKRVSGRPAQPRRSPQPPSSKSADAARGGGRRSGLGGEQVEGRQAVRELLLAGRRRVHEVLVSAGEGGRLDGPLADLAALATDLRVPVRQVARTKLDAAARTEAPQGVLARAEPLPEADLDELVAGRALDGGPPFLVAVDGVTDPGNLGALLRSAECAGVTGVVLPRHRAVHVTPTVTKAAAGAIEHLPMALAGGLPTAIERLKAAGLWVVGLDMGGDTLLDRLPFAADPVVLVLGAEGAGLSRLVRQRCDVVASIPLRGRLESLNVAAAAAIATYEIARRRG